MATYHHILLVDDDPTQLIILHAYFSQMGCRKIIQAARASQALEHIKNSDTPFDLLVSDLMMPDMDGIELLRALKHISFAGSIALVSSLEQTIIDSARKLGNLHQLHIIGTCRKPLNRQALDEVFQNNAAATINQKTKNKISYTREQVQNGLNHQEFIAYYQPKVDILTKQIVGVEALARWQHPEYALLTPNLFMPVIEKNQLTSQLTFCMIEQTLRNLVKWEQEGLDIKAAINVTASEIADLDFPAVILAQLQRYGLSASKILFEVTENEVLEFNTVSLEVLARLRMMGIDIAIDDFGTGYSNLKTLREFPYTELKIDQSFIRGKTKERFSQETIRAAVTLGRQLNMRLLAEGVETREEWDFVKQRGIDIVQGFFIARPMPAEAISAFYHQNDGYAVLEEDEHMPTNSF